MKLKVNMKLNERKNIEVEFENPDTQEAIKEAGFFLDFDYHCPFCNNEVDFSLRTRATGDKGQYKYTEFVCANCKATRQSGAYADKSGIFLKEWKEPFKKD